MRIEQCDLTGNPGPGVRNDAAAPLDARFNWWGDPLGPFGPAGDRLEGNVLFEPFRATPVSAADSR